MIRKALVFLTLFLCTGLTSSNGAFLIQLKDGGEYRTSRYWFEGNEIRFFICGGILGIPRGDVQRITKMPSPDGSTGEESRDIDGCSPQSPPEELEEKGPEAGPASGGVEEDKPPSPTVLKYQQDVKEFEKKLRTISQMSSGELIKLAVEGEALKEAILSAPEVPELRPLLPIVYNGLDEIEDALNGKGRH